MIGRSAGICLICRAVPDGDTQRIEAAGGRLRLRRTALYSAIPAKRDRSTEPPMAWMDHT